jgi:hypothetical protein
LILRRSPFTNARSASQFRPVAGMAALVTDLRLCLARMFATTRKVSARLAPRDAGPGEPQCRRDRCPSVRTRVDAASAAVPLVLRVERRGDLPQRLVRAPVIVDQTTRRMALDADVVPSHQRRAATRFPSRRRPSASPGSGASGTVPRSTRCCGSGCIRIRPSVTWRGHRSGAPCRARGGPGPGDLGRDCSGSEPGDIGHRLSITAPPGLGLGNAGELILSIRSHTICP